MSKTDASPSPAAVPGYRRGFGRRLGPKLLLLATLILILDALVGDKGLLERFREHERFEDVSGSLDSLKRENATLREQARRLREEDPDTIESTARRQLGMIKPGEVLFIVKDVDVTNNGRTPAGPARPSEQRAGKP